MVGRWGGERRVGEMGYWWADSGGQIAVGRWWWADSGGQMRVGRWWEDNRGREGEKIGRRKIA